MSLKHVTKGEVLIEDGRTDLYADGCSVASKWSTDVFEVALTHRHIFIYIEGMTGIRYHAQTIDKLFAQLTKSEKWKDQVRKIFQSLKTEAKGAFV